MSSDRSTSQAAGTGTATFSAADLKRRMAEREAAKAAEELRRMREQEEKQKAVMAEFHRPPERTPDRAERPWPDSASPIPASTDQGRPGQVLAAAMYQAR